MSNFFRKAPSLNDDHVFCCGLTSCLDQCPARLRSSVGSGFLVSFTKCVCVCVCVCACISECRFFYRTQDIRGCCGPGGVFSDRFLCSRLHFLRFSLHVFVRAHARVCAVVCVCVRMLGLHRYWRPCCPVVEPSCHRPSEGVHRGARLPRWALEGLLSEALVQEALLIIRGRQWQERTEARDPVPPPPQGRAPGSGRSASGPGCDP